MKRSLATTPLWPAIGRALKALVYSVILVAVLAWSWRGAGLDPVLLLSNLGNSAEFLGGFLSPDFSEWEDYVAQVIVTLQMALWGSLLATLVAAPLGLLAAANVGPRWIRIPLRRGLDALRSINELVFAFLFMVAVGLGPFAGTMALAMHTTGVLGKLFSEVVEGVDRRPIEGIRSTGATWLEEIFWGILPQVLPLWISHALYRFESNIRSASVVGIVGAGGIGYLLNEYFRVYDYGKVSALVLIIVAIVVCIDLTSSHLRRKLL